MFEDDGEGAMLDSLEQGLQGSKSGASAGAGGGGNQGGSEQPGGAAAAAASEKTEDSGDKGGIDDADDEVANEFDPGMENWPVPYGKPHAGAGNKRFPLLLDT